MEPTCLCLAYACPSALPAHCTCTCLPVPALPCCACLVTTHLHFAKDGGLPLPPTTAHHYYNFPSLPCHTTTTSTTFLNTFSPLPYIYISYAYAFHLYDIFMPCPKAWGLAACMHCTRTTMHSLASPAGRCCCLASPSPDPSGRRTLTTAAVCLISSLA